MDSGTFSISTTSHMELVDITKMINSQIAESKLSTGFCYLYNPHTTAGLTINEGADPAVRHDIIKGLQQIVPMDYPFQHMEGNSPSHIMASLMGSALHLMIEDSRLVLGTWQRIFFCEFDGPRTRKVHWRIYTT